MSHFKILIQHYLSCLLRITVTACSALTRLSDCMPLLHVMYECMRWTYFSLPRHCPQRQLPKKNVNYPCGTTGSCHTWAEGSGKRRGKNRGKKKSTADSSGIEKLEGRQENVSACACDPTHCRLCLCPVNWNTKQSRVDERVSVARTGRGSCFLSPTTLNLHCSLGIDWRTSKRDRHTVTGKMNCHLAFLNLVAASNWSLWTIWRDTDWVPHPPPPFSWGV